MRATVDAVIDGANRTGDLASLYAMLDCDRYTRSDDFRALQGLGWEPRELSAEDIAKIKDAICNIEGRPEDGSEA